VGSRPAHNRWVAAQDIGSGRREPASPRVVSVLTQARAQAGRALQFLRTTEQRSARSRGALAQDTVLALVATVAVLIMIHKLALQPAGTIAPGQPADQNIADGSGAVAMVAGALTTLPLAVRRIFPLTAFWAIMAAIVAAYYGNKSLNVLADGTNLPTGLANNFNDSLVQTVSTSLVYRFNWGGPVVAKY